MKMGGKVSRIAPDNEELSNPSFIMSTWFEEKTCIQGDLGGKQCGCDRDFEEKKKRKNIPSCLNKGGGGAASTLRTRRDRN